MAWTRPKELSGIAQGHYQISWWHEGKVGTAFNYHPTEGGLNYRTNLYYLETADMGASWQNAGGEAVEVPLREVQNNALVHDYEREGVKVYLQDMNFDAEGRPIILYLTSRGWRPGPENGPRTWTTARWNGYEWEIRPVTLSDSNYDVGCLHVEADGTWRIIGPTETGPQPYNPGGEVAMWTSSDQGGVWHMVRQITANSRYNHCLLYTSDAADE